MARYDVSPILEFQYPWINKADTEYNKDGLFHVDGIGSDTDELIVSMKEKIDAAVEEAWAEMTDKMPAKDLKKWSKLYPYEVEEDDEGNPVGRIAFKFKQNAKIKLKDGGFKNVKIGVRDSDDKIVDVPVYGGTMGRIMYSMRAIKVASSFKIGIRLDFAQVQVVELAQGSGGGFGKVDGGFKGEAPSKPREEAPAEDENVGDY